MNKGIWLIALLLLSFSSKAQDEGTPSLEVTKLPAVSYSIQLMPNSVFNQNKVLRVYGGLYGNSNALTNSFYDPWINGGTITNELKQQVLDRAGAFNVVGVDFDYGATYMQRIDSLFGKATPRLSWHVDVADRTHADLRFSENLFELTFFGNQRIAGDTVDLSPLSFNYWRYQHLKVGMNWYGEGNVSFGGSLAFFKGQQFVGGSINRGNFYTDEFGQELALDLNMNLLRSDTSSSNNFGDMNGWGLGTDLYFQYVGDDWGTLSLEVFDLGFITWNDQALDQQWDTTYNFQGVHIDDFEQLRDSLYFDEVVDSVDQAIAPTSKTGAFSTVLPARFNLRYSRVLSDRFFFTTGVAHRLLANFTPYFFFEGNITFDAWGIKSAFGYGGYGGVNFALGAYANIKDKFDIEVRTDHVEGIVAPDVTGGKSLSAALRYYF